MNKQGLLVSILNLFLISSLNADTLVKISQGILNGTLLEAKNGRAFSGFIGIPYAEPPIGKLRFKSPVPGKSWDGVRSAHTVSKMCPQLFSNKYVIGSEDCLYLNVFTPIFNFNLTLEKHTFNGSLLPVMVWIHGGGFISGSSDPNFFNPKFLLEKDIVLVSMNYRLGILGFLSTGDSIAPGNFGLKDQVLALKWVQKNIQVFGGDPNRVTIFGGSAGGVSVSLHALSNATYGLFHQYITQSGSALMPWIYRKKSDFRPDLNELARNVGCLVDNLEGLVECLRDTNLEKLLMPTKYEHFDFSRLHWTPTDELESEDAFLTDSPLNLIEQNKMKDYPSIGGSTLDEGMIVTLPFYVNATSASMIQAFNRCINLTSTQYVKPKDVQKFRKIIQDYYINGIVADEENKDYNNYISSEKLYTSNFVKQLLENFTKFVGDSGFLYPTLAVIERAAKTAKSPVYFYSLAYRGNVNLIFFERNITQTFGVPHGDEILYLFAVVPPNLVTKQDDGMVNLIVDLWTSFAINGKPTSDRLENPNMWQPYQQNNRFLQIGNITNNFDPSVTLENNYLKDRMDFWKANFPLI